MGLLPWAQEVSGSNPGAPLILNSPTLLLRGIFTNPQLENIWEQLLLDNVHNISLCTRAGVRIHV